MKEIICRDGEVAVVDADMYDELVGYNWYVPESGYATACIKRVPYAMHKFVLGNSRDDSLVAHHKSENKLDNRISNLIQITKRVHADIHKKNNWMWEWKFAPLNRKQRMDKERRAAAEQS